MNLGDMILAVRENMLSFSTTLIFRDGNSTDARNTEDPVASVSITGRINAALSRINRAAKLNQSTHKVSGTAISLESSVYVKPVAWSDIIMIAKGGDIDIDPGQNLPYMMLTRIGLEQLLRTGWEHSNSRYNIGSNTLEAIAYYITGNRITFYPKWTEQEQGLFLYFTVVESHAPLSLLSDIPSWVPSDFHSVVVDLATYLCLVTDSANDAAMKRAQAHGELYTSGIEELLGYSRSLVLGDRYFGVSSVSVGEK